MTITLGYWMIPLVLSLAIIGWNCRDTEDDFGSLCIGAMQIAMIPVIWCVYLGLRLWLQ